MQTTTRAINFFGVERSVTGLSNDAYFDDLKEEGEAVFAKVCRSFLRPDGTLLDVGANIGVTTLVAKTIRPNCRVIAIEAAPSIHTILQRNVLENRLGGVEFHAVAAGRSAGEARFFEKSAYGHMLKAGEAAYQQGDLVTVPVKRIDQIVGHRHIDVVKIDVEGFERAVLEGCSGLANQPVYVLEFNAWALSAYGRDNPMDFLEYLHTNFRQAIYLDETGTWAPIDEQCAQHILRRNMRGGYVDNVVCTNAPMNILGAMSA